MHGDMAILFGLFAGGVQLEEEEQGACEGGGGGGGCSYPAVAYISVVRAGSRSTRTLCGLPFLVP
jgi:uncharacterized spore protein YtfJ